MKPVNKLINALPTATNTLPSPPTIRNLIGFLNINPTASAAELQKFLPVN